MGGYQSLMHVGNASSKTMWVRVAVEQTRIKEIEATVGAGIQDARLDASVKAKLDYNLGLTGFARIGPQHALDFPYPQGYVQNTPLFVTITTADDPEPTVPCYNYTPPHSKSIIITEDCTLTLSEIKTDDGKDQDWITEKGWSYKSSDAIRIHTHDPPPK